MTTPFAKKLQKSITDAAFFQKHIEQARELIKASQPRPPLVHRILRHKDSDDAVDFFRESAVIYIILQRKMDRLDNEFQLNRSKDLDHFLEQEKKSLKDQENLVGAVLGFDLQELRLEVDNMEKNRSCLLKSLRQAQKIVEKQKKAQQKAAEEKASKEKAAQEVSQE